MSRSTRKPNPRRHADLALEPDERPVDDERLADLLRSIRSAKRGEPVRGHGTLRGGRRP